MTGPAIRAWRVAQGWTQDQAAARFGMSRSTLSLIELGHTPSTLAAGRVYTLIRQWGDNPPPPPDDAPPRQRGKPGRPRNQTPPPRAVEIRAELARNPRLTDTELAQWSGVSRQAVAQLRRRWGF
jgi:DNA-binding XRE family transcriptional regulator